MVVICCMNSMSRGDDTAGHGLSSSCVYSGFIRDSEDFSNVSDIGSHTYGNIISTMIPIVAPCSICFIVSFDASWACFSRSRNPNSRNTKMNIENDTSLRMENIRNDALPVSTPSITAKSNRGVLVVKYVKFDDMKFISTVIAPTYAAMEPIVVMRSIIASDPGIGNAPRSRFRNRVILCSLKRSRVRLILQTPPAARAACPRIPL